MSHWESCQLDLWTATAEWEEFVSWPCKLSAAVFDRRYLWWDSKWQFICGWVIAVMLWTCTFTKLHTLPFPKPLKDSNKSMVSSQWEPGGVRRVHRVENAIMLLLQNWTDRLETSQTTQRGEEGATLGHIQSIRLHGSDGGKGKVSPRPHFHSSVADKTTWVRRGGFFSPLFTPLTTKSVTLQLTQQLFSNVIILFDDLYLMHYFWCFVWKVYQFIQKRITSSKVCQCVIFTLNLNRKSAYRMKT